MKENALQIKIKHLCIVNNQKTEFEAKQNTTDKDETSVHSFKTHLEQTGWTGLFEIWNWKYNWFELHFGLDVLPTLYYHHQTGQNLDISGVNWSWADQFLGICICAALQEPAAPALLSPTPTPYCINFTDLWDCCCIITSHLYKDSQQQPVPDCIQNNINIWHRQWLMPVLTTKLAKA